MSADLAREYATIFHGIADAAVVAMRVMADNEVPAAKLEEARKIADRARHLATQFDEWATNVAEARTS